jgi:aminoglycoside phosphotransferase (APT) family kinase protein
MPAAEVDVTPALVQRLLAAQHPDLAGRHITKLANGWDNALYRVGPDLVARLPRRSPAARLVLNEQRWLPQLAPGLSLPVPAPVRTGRPEPACYPWPWSIVPYLTGEPAAVAPPRDTGKAAAALGRFLGELHQAAPSSAPANPYRGIPLADREETDTRNLDKLTGHVDRERVLAIWDAARTARRWEEPPMWLHGDLHPLNILVHNGELAGVIDFGDLTAGDPATDLSVAWMLFDDPADRDRFHAAYGTDDATWLRASGWAITFALVYLAHSADFRLMEDIGARTYANLMRSR